MSSTHILAFFRLPEWHVGSVTLFVAGGCGRKRAWLFTDSKGRWGEEGQHLRLTWRCAPHFTFETDSAEDAAAGGFCSCCALEINILTA